MHSLDSSCSLPPVNEPPELIQEIRETTVKLTRALGVVGLMNVQYAVKGGTLFVLEVNPRGSRTVPFVSKAVGMPLAKIGALVASGKRLKDLGVEERQPSLVSVKVPVFPFLKFKEADTILTPRCGAPVRSWGSPPPSARPSSWGSRPRTFSSRNRA